MKEGQMAFSQVMAHDSRFVLDRVHPALRREPTSQELLVPGTGTWLRPSPSSRTVRIPTEMSH